MSVALQRVSGPIGSKSVVAVFCFLVVACLSACATPYQPSGMTGGYVDQQLPNGDYRVSFGGNGYTDTATAGDFATLRAAELALEQGATHFEILDQARRLNQQTVYNGSGGYSTFFTPVATLIIRLHTDPPAELTLSLPSKRGRLLDAAEIRDEIRTRHELDD